MAQKSKLENNPVKSNKYLTTGQVLGIAGIGYSSLYTYVRDFGDLFGPGVQQHRRGRKWGAADLQLVLSIRALRHDDIPTEEIRAKLASGWRVEKSSPWQQDDRDHLVEAFVVLTDETNRIMREAERAVRDSKWVTGLGLEEFQKIQKIEQKQKELEVTIYKILRHLHLATQLDVKKPWWKF